MALIFVLPGKNEVLKNLYGLSPMQEDFQPGSGLDIDS